MKIIYISNIRMPTEKAHGIQIMKMCQSFVEAGNEVELLVAKRFNRIKKDPFRYYGIERNFKIKKFPCLDLIPLDIYLGHLALWIEEVTFFFFVFPYILFKKADIIYTRDYLFLALCFSKKNIIFEGHSFPKNYFLYFHCLKKAKRIIVVTKKLKELFSEEGMEKNKILVAPDAVDLEKFDIKKTREECRKKLKLPSNKKIVLYAGHLYEWKGVQILAQASEYLPEDVRTYFVGGTDKDIKNFRLQTSKFKVQIVGHRPHSEIPYWLKAADVLVLPNIAKGDISKYWTSPIKMFEYMAAKRPIVASDLPSIREVLSEDNAILIKPDYPKGIANGIRQVLENKDLAEEISAKAYIDVQNYSWQKRVENILRFNG